MWQKLTKWLGAGFLTFQLHCPFGMLYIYIDNLRSLRWRLHILKDVAYENVLINHRGTVHDEKNFRSSFPVRYAVIDFGWSEFAPSRGPGSGYMRPPLKSGRITKAQESERGPFDPYAADVWQVSQVLYIYAFVRLHFNFWNPKN